MDKTETKEMEGELKSLHHKLYDQIVMIPNGVKFLVAVNEGIEELKSLRSELQKAKELNGELVMNWIDPKKDLPPKKEGWNHSERVLVWYKGNEYEVEKYGIAYYHYDPPFGLPLFVDFSNYGKQPDLWTTINDPKKLYLNL